MDGQNYRQKYLKYKSKYHQLKKGQTGGMTIIPEKLEPSFDSGKGDDTVRYRLALVELLNFKGSNNQDWDLMKRIYDENVVMKMSDGTETVGIEKAIKMMKEMYVTSPDIKVVEHKIQFGSGNWTAAAQMMKGTFTGPMTDPKTGKVYQPTGKEYTMYACSLLKWNDQNRIIEENIFFDSGDWMKQLGISEC